MSVLLFSLTNFKKKGAPAGKTEFQKGVFEQLKRGAPEAVILRTHQIILVEVNVCS